MPDSLKNSTYANDPDVNAMLEVKAGHTELFNQILDKHYQRIFQFCYRQLSGQSSLAADITQDVFFSLYRMAPRYEPKAKVTTLLFQMARNACLNQLREKHALSIDALRETPEGEMAIPLEDTKGLKPDEQLLHDELVIHVKAAIDALPEAQRTAVLLQRYEQMSYVDIAQAMDTTETAVKSLLNRAKENLEVSLKKYL